MPLSSLNRPARVGRRDFVVAAASAALAGSQALAADEPTSATSVAPKLTPVARAQLQAILGKHEKRLSPQQVADVGRLLADAHKAGQDLRAFPLENADEPALIFHAPASSR